MTIATESDRPKDENKGKHREEFWGKIAIVIFTVVGTIAFLFLPEF